MKRFIIILGVFFVLFFTEVGLVYGDSGRFGVSGKVSTLGAGVEATAPLIPRINARFGINFFNYHYSHTVGDIRYSVDLRLLSFPVLIDWHPFDAFDGFRFSGGLLVNQNELKTKATPATNVHIGDIIYTPAQIGTLRGKIDFNDLAPYVGIGWGNAIGERGLGISFDLGVVFQGSPRVRLTADGTLATQPAFLANLAREEKELAGALKGFRYYPVIALGVFYRF